MYLRFPAHGTSKDGCISLEKNQEVILECEEEVVMEVISGLLILFRSQIEKKIGMGLRKEGERYMFSKNTGETSWEMKVPMEDAVIKFYTPEQVEKELLTEEIVRRIQRNDQQLFLLYHGDAELKFVATMIEILFCAEEFSTKILHKTLAEYTGITGETFGRIRTTFIKEGMFHDLKKGQPLERKHVDWIKLKEKYMSRLPQFHAQCLQSLLHEHLEQERLEKKE